MAVLRAAGVGAAVAVAMAWAGGAGCGSDEFELNVDLRTDLQPGTDFSLVAVTIGAERRPEIIDAATLRATAASGARIAERTGLPAGDVRVVVALRDARGTVIAQRAVRVRLAQDTAITVVITRDCRGVTCPRAGDEPGATECAGGRCVSPECGPASPMACPLPECVDEAACSASVPCARGTCTDATCLSVPLDGRCAAGERCDLTLGCTSAPPDEACGDGRCATGETCLSCATDCGACEPRCGDATCNGAETCGACPTDCGACELRCGDAMCSASETCSGCPRDCGACTPTPPRLDSLEPSSQPGCGCFDFFMHGDGFQPGAQVYYRDVTTGVTADPVSVRYDSRTQVGITNVCSTTTSSRFEVWVRNPDGVTSNVLPFTLTTSTPRIVRVSPSTITAGTVACPTFLMERGGGLCVGATWGGSVCGDPVAATALPLIVDPLAGPGAGTAESATGGCWSAPPDTPPGTYCVWVRNSDGGESDRTVTSFTVLAPAP